MVARRLGQAARRRAAASDRAALDVSRRLPMVKRHAATVMRRAVRLAFLHANLSVSRHVLGPWSFGSQRMHWWQCDARWVGDSRKKSVEREYVVLVSHLRALPELDMRRASLQKTGCVSACEQLMEQRRQSITEQVV